MSAEEARKLAVEYLKWRQECGLIPPRSRWKRFEKLQRLAARATGLIYAEWAEKTR